MEKTILKYAKEHNLIIGVCGSDRMDHLETPLSNSRTPFVSDNIEERINPKYTMKSAQSVIVVGMGYCKYECFEADDAQRGAISVGAVGIDYHVLLKAHLLELAKALESAIPHENSGAFEYMAFVDNGPLIERELAKKAGLGSYGKNFNIISKELGSFFFIGYLLVNIVLKPTITGSENQQNTCNGCNACVKACPSGALGEVFAYDKCVSYLTQKKGELTALEKQIIGNSIYGCDVCQRVCPCNKDVYGENIYEISETRPELKDIVNMTNDEFALKYKKTAAGWRGKNILKRNALIAFENTSKPYGNN